VIHVRHINRFGRPTIIVCDDHNPPVELVIPQDIPVPAMEERFWSFLRQHRRPSNHVH
jgi:hypothetical protein